MHSARQGNAGATGFMNIVDSGHPSSSKDSRLGLEDFWSLLTSRRSAACFSGRCRFASGPSRKPRSRDLNLCLFDSAAFRSCTSALS